MDVLGLIKSKNRCLQRFLDLSNEFLASAEKGDLSGLETLQARRDSTIKAFDLFDRKVTEAVCALASSERTETLRHAVTEALAEKERLIHEILRADDRILAAGEAEKKSIQQELIVSHRNREMLNKFKSTWIAEAGEELDQNV